MSDDTDQPPTKKSLSEISHLFLTSVRDNVTGGSRPTRRPPGSFLPGASQPSTATAANVSVDLTPEEFARTFDAAPRLDALADPAVPSLPDGPVARPSVGPVSALICPQLNGRQAERARDYARHLAAGGDRVGLIEVDAGECRVTCFELAVGDDAADAADAADATVVADVAPFSDGLDELAWDVDRWVLLLPNARLPDARSLLREVNHWTLLSTCDHDGVVSCYRAVKGLADVPRPRLTLALLDATDPEESAKVYRKIAGVCQQFLGWPMTAEPAVEPTDDAVAEHVSLVYRPRADRGRAPQWRAVADFLARAGDDAAVATPVPAAEEAVPVTPLPPPAAAPVRVADFVVPAAIEPAPVIPAVPAPEPTMPTFATVADPIADDAADVAELPGGVVTESAVLSAVMSNGHGSLVECPVKPPACPTATLAIGRDRRLVLLAVAKRGLGEVRAIAAAYKWVAENRPLLSMAMPQFAIDAHAAPKLRLVVDHADAGADLLLPMTENANVSVQTYRKLRWGGKVGLLLDAA